MFSRLVARGGVEGGKRCCCFDVDDNVSMTAARLARCEDNLSAPGEGGEIISQKLCTQLQIV
jgi:hypothetical protein